MRLVFLGLQEHHKGHISSLENHLRLERVNRDTTEARHKGELQKYNGNLAYYEEVAKMCRVRKTHGWDAAFRMHSTHVLFVHTTVFGTCVLVFISSMRFSCSMLKWANEKRE